MEKKKYVKPILASEEFIPQEYIAACGDSNLVYKFECTAPAGDAWQETNGIPGLQKEWTKKDPDKTFSDWIKPDYHIGDGYHPCGATHEAPKTDEFVKGYLVNGEQVRDVIMWRPKKFIFKNTHCTENLNMDSWITAKS